MRADFDRVGREQLRLRQDFLVDRRSFHDVIVDRHTDVPLSGEKARNLGQRRLSRDQELESDGPGPSGP